MAYKLVVKPEAEIDLQEAIEWYKKQIPEGLDIELFREIDAVLNNIAEHPEHFQKRYKDVRIRFTDRFRYGVHYTVEDNAVYVHAIYHTSRRPKG